MEVDVTCGDFLLPGYWPKIYDRSPCGQEARLEFIATAFTDGTNLPQTTNVWDGLMPPQSSATGLATGLKPGKVLRTQAGDRKWGVI